MRSGGQATTPGKDGSAERIPTASNTVSYTYDDTGDRTSETVNGQTTTFLNDPNQAYDQVLEEYAEGGVLAATYIRGIDLLFQQRVQNGVGTLSFYATDNLVSTRALTNSAGAVTDTYSYDAYGDLIASLGNTGNPFLYTGQWFDAPIEQYYVRARYEDTELGRFLSVDPLPDSPEDPLAYDRYLYVSDDATNGTDPSGMENLVSTGSVGTFSAQLATLSGAAIFVGFVVLRSALNAQRNAQLSAIANELGVPIVSDITNLQDPNYKYFAHGTSKGNWGGGRIDPTENAGGRPLDFGPGFYTFLATPQGIGAAKTWARKTGSRTSTPGFVLIVKMTLSDYNTLSMHNYNNLPPAQWGRDVNLIRSGSPDFLSRYDLIIGAFGMLEGNRWVQNPQLPDQYVFKTWNATNKLSYAFIVSASIFN